MAWRSHGRTNEELIDTLFKNGLITSPRVAEAMKKVDRKNYCLNPSTAYQDCPQGIGFNATISAPHMHAHAAENLLSSLPDADGTGAILDVGSGSGYLTAVLHHLAPKATVIGIEHIAGLAERSKENLMKDGVKLGVSEGSGVEIICGDGRAGSPEHAPFQVIHVGAAAPTIPQPLIDQLAKPGRLFIPVGEDSQDIWQVDKSADGNVTKQKLFGVMYVPLTDAKKQWSS